MIVYAITHVDTGRVYIGQTRRTLRHRWRAHISAAKRGIDQSSFHRAIVKFGPDAFSVEVLRECSSLEELLIEECAAITRLRCSGRVLFNDTNGGQGSWGYKHTKERIEKCRARAISRYASGSPHPRCKPCVIDGVQYKSQTDAARILNVTQQQANRWAKTGVGRRKAERSDRTHGYVPWNKNRITA